MMTDMTGTTERATSAEPSLVQTGEKRDALGRRRTLVERRTELLVLYWLRIAKLWCGVG